MHCWSLIAWPITTRESLKTVSSKSQSSTQDELQITLACRLSAAMRLETGHAKFSR